MFGRWRSDVGDSDDYPHEPDEAVVDPVVALVLRGSEAHEFDLELGVQVCQPSAVMGVLVENIKSRPVHGLKLMGSGDLDHLGGLGKSVSVGFLLGGAVHSQEATLRGERMATRLATAARLLAILRPFTRIEPLTFSQ
jgi:hypothetical protein